VADAFTPDRCVSCLDLLDRPARLPLFTPAGLCPDCAAAVIPLVRPRCLDCFPSTDPRVCRRQHHLTVDAAVQYGEEVSALVRSTKYERFPALTAVWLRLWQAAHADGGPGQTGELIVPVPLHPGRVRERGFDVVDLWARRLAHHHGIPLARGLRRERATPQQVGQSRQRRAANVAGAFAPGPDWTVLPGRRLILVDDVVTTGATAREAAGVLLSGGAAAVAVWCFAFEPLE
jgi:ComF family protein